jgi:hypothetical protein
VGANQGVGLPEDDLLLDKIVIFILMRILPIENIDISTTKSVEEIYTILSSGVVHNYGSDTSYIKNADSFLFERILRDKGNSNIIASGKIRQEGGKSIISLEVTCKNNRHLLVSAILWYIILLSLFIFFIYLSIESHQFSFFIFLPLPFLFLSYGFTTLTLQGAVDELIGDIEKAVR